MISDDTPHEPTGIVEDDRLRLIFTCCHPALAPEARVALTLRLLGGLTVAEIAQAFLVPETTMAQRITRAKKKISVAKIPYRVPSAADLGERVNGVLAVIYLVFNEGYLSSSADASPIRDELTGEAIRLARILRALLPDAPEVTGLLALMLLTDARRSVRVADGELVPLHEQDRGGWDRELIAEGHDLVRECLELRASEGHARPVPAARRDQRRPHRCPDRRRHRLGPDRDALLAAVRRDPRRSSRSTARSRSPSSTAPRSRWPRSTGSTLTSYHPWHVTRADLLRRLGRSAEAREAYDAALALTDNEAERAYLTRRRGQLGELRPTGPMFPGSCRHQRRDEQDHRSGTTDRHPGATRGDQRTAQEAAQRRGPDDDRGLRSHAERRSRPDVDRVTRASWRRSRGHRQPHDHGGRTDHERCGVGGHRQPSQPGDHPGAGIEERWARGPDRGHLEDRPDQEPTAYAVRPTVASSPPAPARRRAAPGPARTRTRQHTRLPDQPARTDHRVAVQQLPTLGTSSSSSGAHSLGPSPRAAHPPARAPPRARRWLRRQRTRSRQRGHGARVIASRTPASWVASRRAAP